MQLPILQSFVAVEKFVSSLSKEQKGLLNYLASSTIPSFMGNRVPQGVLSALTSEGKLEDKLLAAISSPDITQLFNVEDEQIQSTELPDTKVVADCPSCHRLFVLDFNKS